MPNKLDVTNYSVIWLAQHFILVTISHYRNTDNKMHRKMMIQYSVKSITFPQLNAKAVQIPVPKSWIRDINYEHGVEGFIFIWNLPLGTGAVSNTCAWLLGIFNYLPASFQTPGFPPLSPWQHPCCQHPVCFCLCSGHLETLLRSLNNKKIIEMYRKSNAKKVLIFSLPLTAHGGGQLALGKVFVGSKEEAGEVCGWLLTAEIFLKHLYFLVPGCCGCFSFLELSGVKMRWEETTHCCSPQEVSRTLCTICWPQQVPPTFSRPDCKAG